MQRVMSLYYFLFFLLINITLFSGCQKPDSIKRDLISGSKYKLWQRIRDTSYQKGFSTYLYYFDTKGTWRIYVRNANDKKVVKADFGDIVMLENWHLIDTSQVNIGGGIYNIETLNDSIFSY